MPKNISLLEFLSKYWFIILFIAQLEYFAVGTYINVQEMKAESNDGKVVDQAIINCLVDHALNPYKYIPGEVTVRGTSFSDAKHEDLLTLKN